MRDILKNWLLNNADSKYSYFALFGISFIEASFFIIPPDIFLIPLVLARRNKWIFISFITTLGSVVGGIFGYIIGLFFFELFGAYILDVYNLKDYFLTVGNWYSKNAFLAVFISAFTFIPFKVFTLAAGLFKINFFIFIFASAIGRGLRFFIAYNLHNFINCSFIIFYNRVGKC